ncbi:MAG TPA: tol-pal system protein YbgF [Bryobacteraceae bacterium]|nr:tol-pal system protein YbgF [Bryobacteraceae bacterium]
MKFRRLLPAVLFVFPAIGSAASKEIVELQRDVAQLQDQVRSLQSAFDTKMAQLQVLVQQASDSATRASNAVSGLQGAIQEQLRTQGKEVVGPVAGLNSKIDELTTSFQQVQNSMADVTARLGKLEQQMTDLSNAVRTMNTPAAPPPGSTPGTTPGSSVPGGVSIPPGDVLYQNAYRDKLGGKNDLALQEFTAYLQNYPDQSLAPAAQFWVGDIYFAQGDYDNALKAFDTVLVKYPANNKTPDAFYMKGRTLVQMNQRNNAAKEFREVIRRYPGSDAASKARAQLKQMGLSPTTAARRR